MKKIKLTGLILATTLTLSLIACNKDNISTSSQPKNENIAVKNLSLTGSVKFPDYRIKSDVAEIAKNATVSIIYLPDYFDATLQNTVLASGLSGSDGNFTINFSASFSPPVNQIFILEARRRTGGAGSDSMTLSSYIKWNGIKWQSITYPVIKINANTTALTLITALDPLSASPSDTINKIEFSGGGSVIQNVNTNVTSQKINEVASLVIQTLVKNKDPNHYINFQGQIYFIKGNSDVSGQIGDGTGDNDGDSINDIDELKLGTNPFNIDSDNDGITDDKEDSDSDTLTDAQEVLLYHTNPYLTDSDNDGLTDKEEVTLGTQGNNMDTDGDGILDGWEVNGLNGLDLNSIDGTVDPKMKDVFIHVDWMGCNAGDQSGLITTTITKPGVSFFTQLKDMFLRHNIKLHIRVSDTPVSCLDKISRSDLSYQNNKALALKLDNERKFFHYALISNSSSEVPAGSNPSGVSEDITSHGSQGFLIFVKATDNNTTFEKLTFAHELGHNLGLFHGGSLTESFINYKPNYLSIMNYLYQYKGVRATLLDASQLKIKIDNVQASLNSPVKLATDTEADKYFDFDYSNGKLSPLDENNLDENVGIGLGMSFNWNLNGIWETNVNNVIIHDEDNSSVTKRKFNDFDDWSNLKFDFARNTLRYDSSSFSDIPTIIHMEPCDGR